MSLTAESSRRGAGLLGDPTIRAFLYQALLVAFLVGLVFAAARNAYVNMEARGIPLGFSFWDQTAGFDINQTLIPYTALSTYGRAFWVGLVNTALVAVLGIALATPLGFLVGVARLSPNWILAKAAMIYVELMRNTPLLLQLLFWYNAVLKTLPGPRQSLSLWGAVFLNNRGLYLPDPKFAAGADWILAALAIGIAASIGVALWARARQAKTGAQAPVTWIALALTLGAPTAAYFAAGEPIHFELARLSGFNLRGGLQLYPEFAALVFGLVTYTAGFIAEIVRAGVLAVSKGQSEAASALGLSRGATLKLVVVPQAMRLITPPLTSQYLNIVKNSSLAVFIGYPDLVQIFAGTVLNQTQAAVQVMAITMAVYLAISLAVSLALNLYGARNALKER
ncbi:MAG TPA: amino acid ABC transporter permease [Roseiarcus sp.]|nr:amino acid ABC transporter permease [Roseiarcus sp.]